LNHLNLYYRKLRNMPALQSVHKSEGCICNGSISYARGYLINIPGKGNQ
jgi:hypothetical protein